MSAVVPLSLVCLPFAGGGSAVFHRWRPQLSQWINVLPITLPGHDGRLNEPPRADLHTLVAELADDLSTTIDSPYALLGHSMGGWLAFELSRTLRRRGRRMPILLIVAATPAPQLACTESPLHALPDGELLIDVERRYGAIPTAVKGSAELLQLLLPALRADLQMVETYKYADDAPLDVEILALGGTDDAMVSATQLDGWRRHSTIACSVRLLPGGHFFLFDGGGTTRSDRLVSSHNTSPAVQIIVNRLQQRLGMSHAN